MEGVMKTPRRSMPHLTPSPHSVLPRIVFLWAAVVALLAGCSTSGTARGTPASGTYLQTTPLHYQWSPRTYLLHVPAGYDEQKTWPLVVALHGAFSTAGSFETKSGFSDLADRAGFVVAYPNGIGVLGHLQHWNAGHCCGLAEEDHVDDVGFLRYVIDDVARKVRIDPQRVYVAGHSNGAMLAYQFAAENSEKIAAVCVVAGSLGSARSKGAQTHTTGPPAEPVPLLAIHGRQDACVPFAGGSGVRRGGRCYVSVLDSVGLWARYCGCHPTPEISGDPHGGPSLLTWRDAQGDSWASLYILDHWEHAWPGACNCRQLPPEHPLRTFDAAEVIWDFFSQHPQDRPPQE
jgi:polyhydroxybutyrate depolymerase